MAMPSPATRPPYPLIPPKMTMPSPTTSNMTMPFPITRPPYLLIPPQMTMSSPTTSNMAIPFPVTRLPYPLIPTQMAMPSPTTSSITMPSPVTRLPHPVTPPSDFLRCASDFGRTAMDVQRYDAILRHATALSLDPPFPQSVLVERSKANLATGSWKQALDDANQVHDFVSRRSTLLTYHDQVIVVDPSSPRGYEMKHAALHMAGDYENAIKAFKTMLSKLPDRKSGGRGFNFG